MKKKLLRAIAKSMAVVSRKRKRFADIFEKLGVVLAATSVLPFFGVDDKLDRPTALAIMVGAVVLFVLSLLAEPGDKNNGGKE
tara:strand:+ start:7369 stop:7617 length:249 start_codon:yes stop_codon:yes gene_type:complete